MQGELVDADEYESPEDWGRVIICAASGPALLRVNPRSKPSLPTPLTQHLLACAPHPVGDAVLSAVCAAYAGDDLPAACATARA